MITAIPNTMRKYAGKVRGKYGAAMEDYNGVQDSLLSGANTMKVTGFDKRARDIIQEKNEAIVSEEKKLNKSQLRVVGVAGGNADFKESPYSGSWCVSDLHRCH